MPTLRPDSPPLGQHLEPVGRSSEGSSGDGIVKGPAISSRSLVSASGAMEDGNLTSRVAAAPSEERGPEVLTRSVSERSGAGCAPLALPLLCGSPGKLSARSSAGGGVGAAQVEIRGAEAEGDSEQDSPSAPGVPSDSA